MLEQQVMPHKQVANNAGNTGNSRIIPNNAADNAKPKNKFGEMSENTLDDLKSSLSGKQIKLANKQIC